ALRDVWRAPMQKVVWTESDGERVEGGLYLPRGAEEGARLPLVIQVYHYSPDLFLPDGPHNGTADAGQSLVARGFAVLQLEGWKRQEVMDTEAEGPGFVTRLDAAIDRLAARGVVDPARVGLTGFSRGGFLTRYALANPGKHAIAAA